LTNMEKNAELLKILRSDVRPALGCTGPLEVIYAAAAAAKAVGGELESISMILDRDTYKNCISVATPGTDYMGVTEAAVLGALYGNPDLGLEVLRDLGEYDAEFVETFAKEKVDVKIRWDLKMMAIYTEVFVNTTNGTGHVIVARTHDGVVLKEANGKVLYKDESYSPESLTFEAEKPIRKFTVKDIYDFAVSVPAEDIAFLAEAIKKNCELAEAGLKENTGSNFGLGFSKIGDGSGYSRAKLLAAAASDARMSGVALPAMSCGGSGNVGITGCVPLVCMAEELGSGEEELHRALAMSYLLIILVKAHIGRLSPLCACALAASIGVTAGTTYLMGGDFDRIQGAISSLVGSIGGVLCDGAKFGCAMKLATGAGVAIDCAKLAMEGINIRPLDGLVGTSAQETIELVGRLASRGMLKADEDMCREIIRREGVISADE